MRRREVLLLLALLVIGTIVYYLFRHRYEFFATTGNTAGQLSTVCAKRESCSACLAPVKETIDYGNDPLVLQKIKELEAAGGSYYKAYVPACGWCPTGGTEGKGACVARADNYPIVPRASGGGDPLFTCPVATFVASKADCADVKCSDYTNCKDCAGYVKCGWCPDTATCLPKKADGSPDVPAGKTCAAKSYVSTTDKCPQLPCAEIKGCAECAATPGCGYCALTGKCLKLQKDDPTLLPGDKGYEVLEECATGTGDDVKRQVVKMFPSQCPGGVEQPSFEGTRGSEDDKNKNKPTAGELSSVQDNTWSDATTLTSAQDNSAPPPSDEEATVSAPGLLRPANGSSERPTFPTAVNLAEDKPFETYVQMLVRSEMAAQGVPTNEPFQIEQVIANAGKHLSAKRWS